MAKKNPPPTSKNPAVSIIIPMFNAEKYIEPCLQSILNQTFDDFEVIVVDDCSTDHSVELVKNFFDRFDGRLSLLKTKKNSGNAVAPRNLALKSARGKYVTFVDNDDLLDKNAIENLITNAERFDTDLVITERFFELNGEELSTNSYQHSRPVEQPALVNDDIGKRISDFVNRCFLWDVWGKLFRRDLLVKHKIEFPRVVLFEDFCFFIQALVHAKSYVRIPERVYVYRNRAESLSHDPPHPFDITRNMIEVFRVLDRFLSSHEYFINHRTYRYMLLDFFVQRRIELVSKNIYALSEASEIDEYLRRHIFNANPQENVALTCYLFDFANLARLTIDRLSDENRRLTQALNRNRKELAHG